MRKDAYDIGQLRGAFGAGYYKALKRVANANINPQKIKSWGRIVLYDNLELVIDSVYHKGIDGAYPILDLESKHWDSIEAIDTIIQVSKKTWATNEDIGNLVRALDWVFNIQSQLRKRFKVRPTILDDALDKSLEENNSADVVKDMY